MPFSGRSARAKDDFLAMLGHELRNPLAPIVMALHLLQLRCGSGAEKELVVIQRQVNHLNLIGEASVIAGMPGYGYDRRPRPRKKT